MILSGFIPILSPGINKTYTKNKHNGRTILTTPARKFKKDAGMIIGSLACEWEDKYEFYKLTIHWWGGRHDVDAHTKIFQDVLCAKLGFDDNRIKEQDIKKLEQPMQDFFNENKGIFFKLEGLKC